MSPKILRKWHRMAEFVAGLRPEIEQHFEQYMHEAVMPLLLYDYDRFQSGDWPDAGKWWESKQSRVKP